MAKNSEINEQRSRDMKALFDDLYRHYNYGSTSARLNMIYDQLASMFYLTPRRVRDILKQEQPAHNAAFGGTNAPNYSYQPATNPAQ